MSAQLISIDNIDAFIFDFDGVLTDNLVHLSDEGVESVSSSRADGLGFEALRKLFSVLLDFSLNHLRHIE